MQFHRSVLVGYWIFSSPVTVIEICVHKTINGTPWPFQTVMLVQKKKKSSLFLAADPGAEAPHVRTHTDTNKPNG